MSNETKLALGTVQFGLPYGVANRTGITPAREAADIIELSRNNGIDTLDTAIGYGESESVLGRSGISNFKVITKLPGVIQNQAEIALWVTEHVHASLRRLRLPSLNGVLLHRPAQLLESYGSQLYASLQALKTEGLIEKIGISIYEPSELENLIPDYKFDLIQGPLNVLDRRLIDSGWANRLHDLGIEIHTRSCFLQGLLLMPAKNRPAKFNQFKEIWQLWDAWISAAKCSPIEACLHYAISQPTISKVVIGAETVTQLNEIISAAKKMPSSLSLPDWPGSTDTLLLNPSNWASL